MANKKEVATLAGGCFWCLEAIYNDLDGVVSVESGYSGGHAAHPTYQQVCDGNSGHAEVVQVHFDPQVISYQDLLTIFFTIHDPTTLNRQGNDVGSQYRSAIFYHDEEQRKVAENVVAKIEAEGLWQDPIVTELSAFEAFFPAEAYHQGYFKDNPYQPYCQVVIAPKVAKFRQKYASRLKGNSGGTK